MTAALEARDLTTGKVASLCGVAPRTVSKWCDTGKLKHYRIPGSKDRRIERTALRDFLEAHGMPVPNGLVNAGELAAIGLTAADLEQLSGDWRPLTEYGLGEMAATVPIAALIVGDAWGVANAVALAARVKGQQPRAKVAVLVGEDVGAVPGWEGLVVRRPVNWEAVAKSMAGTRGR